MTITIEIRSELEAELTRRAAAQGRGIEAYAATLLEEAAHLLPEAESGGPPAKDIAELFAPLRGLNLDFGRNPSTGRPVDL